MNHSYTALHSQTNVTVQDLVHTASDIAEIENGGRNGKHIAVSLRIDVSTAVKILYSFHMAAHGNPCGS